MGDLLFYLLKSGCYLIIFYLLFKLLMSGTTFFRFNRVTILAGIIGCMFLPLIEFTTQEETFLTVPLQTIQGIFVEQADGIFGDTMFWVRPQVDETGNMQAINWCPIALGYVYLAGGLFVLCRILLSFYRMFQLIRNGKRRSYGKYKLIVVSEPISSFCWGKYIVVSVSDYSQQSTDGILLHETMHLRYRHTLDLLCMQCLLILYWFNPAIWLLKRELQEVHEFEADNGVLNTGIDATRYQLLLVKKAVGTRLYSMANGFNHSKLKKRITMMLKEKSNPWAKLKYLYILPVAAIAVTAFARPEISETAEEISAVKVNDLTAIVEAKAIKSTEESVQISTVSQDTVKVNYVPTEVSRKLQGTAVFEVVEEMPEFPGGVDAMMEYLQKELRYPESAKEKGIQGRVTVQFIIDKEGNVTNSKVTRSVDKDMDTEAIRLVKAMPKWKPGMQKGKAVAVKYTVPVVFRLEGGKTVNSQVTVNSKVSEFSVQGMNNPLYIVDGKEVTSSILSALDVNKIESMTVLKNESATEVYGEKGKNGVILITLKGSAEKSITLSNKSSVVNVPGLKGVYLNNRRAEWEDVDIFVDGEKIEMAGRALDEVVPPNRIESISVEKERNEAGRGKIYITTKAKEGVEKTSVRGDMKVEGFVQDKDGEPIVGATVLIEGTNMGTVTDVDGRFVMSASKEDKLVVSYIGMKGTKVKVASKVTITLKDE